MATTTYSPSGTDILHLVELDMTTRKQITEPVHLVQYDDRLPILEVHLYKDDASYSCPSGSEVNVRYEKPDNKVVYNPVLGWNQDRSVIYVQVSIQMTTAYGEANAILEIKTGEKVAGSANFLVVVERNPVQDGAILSTDEVLDLQGFVDDAKSYAEQASASANTAKSYKDAAASSATQASTSKSSAQTSATQAANSATSASGYADTAKTYQDNAATSATQAEAQKTEATKQAQLSKSYAVGTDNVTRPNDQTDNSKAYAEKAKQLTERAQALLEEAERLLNTVSEGGIVPRGPKAFEDLPTDPSIGSMYNITNDFVTDDRFAEGSGISYPAGTNIYWTAEGNWDVMVGSVVSGVKGSAEADYHQGFVDISPSSIGLENVENTTDAEKRVAYADEAGSLNNTLQITKGGTGSTTQKGALNNLTSGGRLGEYSVLISNWNNAATSGFYNSNSESQNVPNTKPNKWYGIVNARTNNYIQQILYGFYEEKLHCFGRELIPTVENPTGSWSGWSELDADASGEIVNPITAGHQLHLANDVMGLKEYCTEITDWNEATKNGWYWGASAENQPNGLRDVYMGYVIAAENWVRQIAYCVGGIATTFKSEDMARFERLYNYNTWSDWIQAGPVFFNQGTKVIERASNISAVGYLKLCSLTITDAWADQPILMAIEQRGRWGNLSLKFEGTETTDPNLEHRGKTGNLNDVILMKTAESNWDLYLNISGYDRVIVSDFTSGNRIKVEWKSDIVTALPEGTKYPFVSLNPKVTYPMLGNFFRYAIEVTDWNSATENGIYCAYNAANEPTIGWYYGLTFAQSANYCRQILYHFTTTGESSNMTFGNRWERFKKNTLGWSDWKNTTPVTKEEAGSIYKLATLITDWNDAKESGWYRGNAAANEPAGVMSGWWYGLVIQQSPTYVIQILYPLISSGYAQHNAITLVRYSTRDTWSAWLARYSFVSKKVDANFKTQFRTQSKGNDANESFLSMIRTDAQNIEGAPVTSAGLAWGQSNSNGYLMPSFNKKEAWIGGGDYNRLIWLEKLVLDSDIGRFSKTVTHVTDWNAITETGFYDSDKGAANAPESTQRYAGLCIVINNNTCRQIVWTVITGVQDVFAGDRSAVNKYERVKENGGWGPWKSTILKQPIGNIYQNIIPLNKYALVTTEKLTEKFRSIVRGYSGNGEFFSVIRKNTGSITTDGIPLYSAGLAWGSANVNGFLMPIYNSHRAFIGGGVDETLWIEELVFKSQLASAIDEKITKSKTVSQDNFIPDAKTVFSAITALENRISILETGGGN